MKDIFEEFERIRKEFTIKSNGRKRSFYEESDYELDMMTSEECERSGLGEIVYT